MADNSWQEIENPWAEKSDMWLQHPERMPFCLTGEDAADFQIQIPPQPFQGTPNAKIWVLALNPGYQEADGVFYRQPENRKAILRQLRFEKLNGNGYHQHYVLNPEYLHSVEYTDQDGYKQSRVNYSCSWFKEHFFGAQENKEHFGLNESNIDQTIFLLQACAYASPDFPWNLNTLNFSHQEYAKKLLYWAMDQDKIIVISRCRNYWMRVIGEYFVRNNPDRVFVMANPRNLHFSKNNLLFFENRNERSKKGKAVEKMEEYITKAIEEQSTQNMN